MARRKTRKDEIHFSMAKLSVAVILLSVLLQTTSGEECQDSGDCVASNCGFCTCCNGTCSCTGTTNGSCSQMQPSPAVCSLRCRDGLITACLEGEGHGTSCENSNECRTTLSCVDKKCSCTVDMYYDAEQSKCHDKKDLDEVCTDKSECRGNLSCLSSKCSCTSEQAYDSTETECVKFPPDFGVLPLALILGLACAVLVVVVPIVIYRRRKWNPPRDPAMDQDPSEMPVPDETAPVPPSSTSTSWDSDDKDPGDGSPNAGESNQGFYDYIEHSSRDNAGDGLTYGMSINSYLVPSVPAVDPPSLPKNAQTANLPRVTYNNQL